MERPNLSRETQFSGANGDGMEKNIFPVFADHEQDWQPIPGRSILCYKS